MESKECKSCKEVKPLSEYYKSSVYTWIEDGHDYYCKYCRNGANLKSQRNTEKTKKCTIKECEKQHYARGYCRTHYARLMRNGTTEALWTPFLDGESRVREYEYSVLSKTGKKYTYKRNLTYNREVYLKHKFNITLDEFNEMSKNGCQICSQTTELNFHVDHDHACCAFGSCGKCIRGIVCNKCNTNIGHFERGTIRKDNPLYKKIEKYLAKYAKKRAKIDNS